MYSISRSSVLANKLIVWYWQQQAMISQTANDLSQLWLVSQKGLEKSTGQTWVKKDSWVVFFTHEKQKCDKGKHILGNC